MNPEVSFHGYLRHEVDNAGSRYEQARQRVFELTRGEEIEPGPALLEATESLAEDMKTYINALRRLAHFAAHKARPSQQKQFAARA